jgi:4-hydroxythreonine-4-phosphate dehydrogenase
MNLNDQIKIAITLGDPAGIGPEVVLKTLAAKPFSNCDITVVGSRTILQETYNQLQKCEVKTPFANPENLQILDIELHEEWGKITTGEGNSASGAASFADLETAIARTLTGEFQGIVTGPISKTCWQTAGYHYPGQTELLAERSGVKRFGMLFVAKSPHSGWLLRTLLATTHIPLCQVSAALNPDLLSIKLDLLVECLRQDFGLEKPRIAISGLNPHSGENGKMSKILRVVLTQRRVLSKVVVCVVGP